MEQLAAFKDYLADRPTVAFLALSLVALFYMFRKYDRSQKEKLEMVQQLVPLTDKLCKVIERIKAFQERWGE